jgi:serine protease Do
MAGKKQKKRIKDIVNFDNASYDSAYSKASENTALKVVLLVLLVGLIGFAGGWLGSRFQGGSERRVVETRDRMIIEEGEAISALAEQVGPSVVSVNVVSQGSSQLDFFGFSQPVERESAGTGVIIEDNVIITNRHVIPSSTTDLSITLSDGTELTDIEVIGRTSPNDSLDIAFLKVNDTEGNELPPAQIGDSSEVKVGDRVIAIGNALGQFQNTVTSGIISGYGRDIQAAAETGTETLQNLFQTDAAINQGNSGGPLVNFSGEVIGINTAVAGGRAQNIGFSIPINDVKGLISSVLERGILERPYLGIRYVNLTDDLAFQFGLDISRGAFILPSRRGADDSILPGSPAEKADLRERDVITEVDGVEVGQGNSLSSLIGSKRVGETIPLRVQRGDEVFTVDVTLEASPTQE